MYPPGVWRQARAELRVIAVTEPEAQDAAAFARRHAGEQHPGLSPQQRDLLGRVIARRIERGAKLETIARAVAHALPALGEARARRLGRDEALRALAWEQLRTLRARGETRVTLSAAANACPSCQTVAGLYALVDAPPIPVPGCTHTGGCRCLYRSAVTATPDATDAPRSATRPEKRGASGSGSGSPEATLDTPLRPWYRPHPPRPHGPRWPTDPATGGKLPPRAVEPDGGPRRPDWSKP